MADDIARVASQPIEAAAGGAPEWVHLLPAGTVHTQDGRGPYRLDDPAPVIAASLSEGDKLVLCENHATDIAAPKGRGSPARGWIVAMEARSNGIWGRVEWTADGRRLVETREYRGISPVIAHRKDGTIAAIRRATLTNTPNLTGLQTLHSEDMDMEFRLRLIEALGLSPDAAEEAILAAIRRLKGGQAPADRELQRAQETERLVLNATAYQNNLADAGFEVDFATAVLFVQDRGY